MTWKVGDMFEELEHLQNRSWHDRRGSRLHVGDLVRYVGVLPGYHGQVYAVEEMVIRGGVPVIVLRAGSGIVQTSGPFVEKQPELDGECERSTYDD